MSRPCSAAGGTDEDPAARPTSAAGSTSTRRCRCRSPHPMRHAGAAPRHADTGHVVPLHGRSWSGRRPRRPAHPMPPTFHRRRGGFGGYQLGTVRGSPPGQTPWVAPHRGRRESRTVSGLARRRRSVGAGRHNRARTRTNRRVGEPGRGSRATKPTRPRAALAPSAPGCGRPGAHRPRPQGAAGPWPGGRFGSE